MALPSGTHIGAYEILGALGAGGMGEVYRAVDPRLGRHVALKILPPGLALDPAAIDRFRQEARSLAALNHPNIVTIYSVEEQQGLHFLTMEVVDGQPLDRDIPVEGLPVASVLSLAAQLADALAAAHAKGVIHRDLKPANVIVTSDGRLKVLDFGLAKMPAAGSDASALTMARTRPGMVMGTLPYMSPEQVEGKELDARSDLFSFGILLHELLAGRRPFAGDTEAGLISAILRDVPRPLGTIRTDVPPALDALVLRCLEKNLDRRIQTARDIQEGLRAIPPGGHAAPATGAIDPGGRTRRSIVVLPFANLSPDPANDYLGDGITEEVISDLAKVRALSVISRTSAMQLRGVKKDARTLGRELDVQFVVDGSVRKAGNSLRITAQLVDAATDAPLWTEKYSGTVDDVFEVQERVARDIVGALDIRLTSDEHRQLGERPIADPRAFELFLQARQEIRRYAPARAVAMVEEAMQLEGRTPPLTALLTWTKILQVRSGMSPDRSLLLTAEQEARQLLAHGPTAAALGHSLLGHVEYERGGLPDAAHHLKLAIDGAPNDSDTIMMLAIVYVAADQHELAQATARRMMSCDPLSSMSWMAAGVPLWFVGRVSDSLAPMLRGAAIDPQNVIVRWAVGYIYALLGRLDEAAHHAGFLNQVGPDLAYSRQLLSLVDALAGRRAEALARIAAIDPSRLDSHHQFHLAESFIVAGEHDRGLDLLEASVEGFYPELFYSQICPFLEPVRGSARFEAIVGRAHTLAAQFPDRLRQLGG